ncbi:MAG: hypothetical protein HYV16_12580 [Gammaproteobacteria bacterium]|nr:hypothetical protein [Gammaproteobacteria bacterium]
MTLRKTLIALLLCTPLAAPAENLFVVAGQSGNDSFNTHFNDAEEATEFFADSSLTDFLPSYDDGTGAGGITTASAASFLLDFRGLPMNLSFDSASPTLNLNIGSLGIHQHFEGATRRESVDLFVEWMKENQDGNLDRIMAALAEVSPVDPIAGNPASLMNQMIDDVAADSMFVDSSEMNSFTDQGKDSENRIGLGLDYARYDTDRGNQDQYRLPLSYTVRFDGNPDRQLMLKLPVTYTTVDGARSYALPFSAILRWPVNPNWTLTPAVTYGITGSEELGSGGKVYSYFLTSSYVIRLDSMDLTIGNMAGRSETLETDIGDYSFEPELKNTVLRNGVLLSMPTDWLGGGNRLEFFLVNTTMSGSDLYLDKYNVVGASFGPRRSQIGKANEYNFGFKYLFSSDIKAYTLNVKYWF